MKAAEAFGKFPPGGSLGGLAIAIAMRVARAFGEYAPGADFNGTAAA